MSDPQAPVADDRFYAQPTLTDVLHLLGDRVSLGLRVCLPCEVTAIVGNQLVDLQPLLRAVHVAQAPMQLPKITRCPVSMPMGNDWSVKYPLAVGDTGYAIFCDRALDDWSAGGGMTTPTDDRAHDLSDAIFVPGLVPIAKQTQDATQDLVLRNGTAQVRLEKNGTFRIANNGQELVDLVGQLNAAMATLTQTLQQAMTITLMGPQPLWSVTQGQLAQTAATLQTLASNLQTLKGV